VLGKCLVQIIWSKAEKSLKFDIFGNLFFKAFKFLRFSNVSMKETVLNDSHGNFGWKSMTEYIYKYGTQNTGKQISKAEFDFVFLSLKNHIIQHHYIWNFVWNSYR